MDSALLMALIGALALVVYRELSAIHQVRRLQREVQVASSHLQKTAAEIVARLQREAKGLSDQITSATAEMGEEHARLTKTMHAFTAQAAQIDGVCAEARAKVRSEVDAALGRLRGRQGRG